MALDTNSKEVSELQNPAPGKVKMRYPFLKERSKLRSRRWVFRHWRGEENGDQSGRARDRLPCETKRLGFIRGSAPLTRDSLHRYRTERGTRRRPEP
ncbi:hypothetical protein BHM03_00062516 [Ensete ventricosum]|nr:hypothetical protein BHM03_00062516 [Ensete ventricosum]